MPPDTFRLLVLCFPALALMGGREVGGILALGASHRGKTSEAVRSSFWGLSQHSVNPQNGYEGVVMKVFLLVFLSVFLLALLLVFLLALLLAFLLAFFESSPEKVPKKKACPLQEL